MKLSDSQIVTLQEGEPVTVFLEEAGVDCVIVRADRFRSLAPDDDFPRVAYPAMLKAWNAVGSPDDGNLYQDPQERLGPESSVT